MLCAAAESSSKESLRKARSNGRFRKDILEGRLSQRHLFFQKLELLQFLEPLGQPLARAVAPVIRFRKGGLLGIFSLEEA